MTGEPVCIFTWTTCGMRLTPSTRRAVPFVLWHWWARQQWCGYDGSVAVRGVFGIAWLPHKTPIDVFLEIVPSLQLTSSTGFGLDAGLGARYFF